MLKDIYTISAVDILAGDDVTPMRLSVVYYDEEEAINAAKEFADEMAGDESVVEVSVFAGEQEDENTHDITGETIDIFTATNVTRERSVAARTEACYVMVDGLDYYAGEQND